MAEFRFGFLEDLRKPVDSAAGRIEPLFSAKEVEEFLASEDREGWLYPRRIRRAVVEYEILRGRCDQGSSRTLAELGSPAHLYPLPATHVLMGWPRNR
jgi:hypothetical protein